MKELYHCTECGFLSTRRSEYEVVYGKLVCTCCVGRRPGAICGIEPICAAAYKRRWLVEGED